MTKTEMREKARADKAEAACAEMLQWISKVRWEYWHVIPEAMKEQAERWTETGRYSKAKVGYDDSTDSTTNPKQTTTEPNQGNRVDETAYNRACLNEEWHGIKEAE